MATEVIQKWTFGEPTLAYNKNSIAYWARGMSAPRYHQSGAGWKACLHGRAQTGDDWAALVIPVNEMPLTDFYMAKWSYIMTSAQSMGANIVIWAHDPDNFIYRAEITQLGGIAGLTKTSGRNAHVFDPTATQMFYYGEITGTPDTCPTAGTLYTWAQFKDDSIFKNYTIYKVTIEMGWEASGTFDQVFVGDLILNNKNILLKPRSDADLAPVHTYYTGSSDITTGNGTVNPKTPFRLLSASLHLDVNPGEAAPFIIQVLRDNDKHATYYDTVLHTSDMYVPTDALSRHVIFGEGYEFAEDDVIALEASNDTARQCTVEKRKDGAQVLTATHAFREGVTVIAQREVIQLDVSGSQVILEIGELTAVPTRSVQEALALEVGVGVTGDIRGGTLDQTQVIVDGHLAVDKRFNTPVMVFNSSASFRA